MGFWEKLKKDWKDAHNKINEEYNRSNANRMNFTWLGRRIKCECGYEWQSRRAYYPCKCPRCNSRNLLKLGGNPDGFIFGKWYPLNYSFQREIIP